MSVSVLTKSSFEEEVYKSDKPVLIDFWAQWCMPCRMLSPLVDQISEEYADKYKVCKVNVDEEPELAAKFYVTSIPTLVVIKNGELINRTVGSVPKAAIIELLENPSK